MRRAPEALCAVAAAFLAAAPPIARAGDAVEIGGVDLQGLLDLPVDAVTLHEERAGEAAASVWVIAAEDIRDQGFRTLGEALRSVPGLFGYRDGYFPAFAGVRGLGLAGDESTRVLVLVDGHPLNNSIGLAQSYLGRDFPIPLDAVKRIEVVKGPVGSVYGPTAFEAVINVVTLDAWQPRAAVAAVGEASQGRASAGSLAGHVAALHGGVRLFAAAEAFDGRGADYAFPELLADRSRASPSGATMRGLDASRAGTAYGRLEWRGVGLSGGVNGASGGLPTAPYGTLLDDPGNRLSTRTRFAELTFDREVAERLALRARASYDDFDSRDVLRYAPPPEGWGTYRDRGTDRWWSGELRLTWSPAARAFVTTGATVQEHETTQRSWAEGFPTVVEDPATGAGVGEIAKTFRSVNAYALAEWSAVPGRLRLHGGVTWFASSLFESRVTPKAALVWTPATRDVVKLVYAEGFRAPTIAEAYFEDGTDFAANPRLRPETVRSYELVWQHRVSGSASLDAALFDNEYRDLIRYVTVPASGLAGAADPANAADWRQQANNVASLSQRGGELGVNVHWGDRLRAWGGVSVQRASDATLPNFPGVTGNFAVASRAPWRPLTLALNGSVVGGRHKDTTALPDGAPHTLGTSLLLNAAADLRVRAVRGLSFQLAVRNLLGAEAPSPLPGDDAPVSAIADAPRTIRLVARWSP